jgi:hypothetical protein
MNPSFPDWYRSATVTVPEGRLEKRWAGVQSICEKSDRPTIVALAAQFVLPGRENLVTPGFRESFHAHDDVFPMKDNLEELRVLAGATLREIISRKGSSGRLASLALVCGAFGPRRAAVPVQDHLDAAQAFVNEESKRVRECHELVAPQTLLPTKEVLGTRFPDGVFAAPPQLRAPLMQTLSEISVASAELQHYAHALSHRVLVREEELNLLWWLQTEFSRDLNKSFLEVGPIAGCAVFAGELADLTEFLPGPGAILAILLKAARIAGAPSSSEQVTLRDIVNATPREWRERLEAKVTLSSIELLCPVHLAITKSLLTDGVDNWLPVYQKACDIDSRHGFPLAALTMQVYQERMLEACMVEPA